MRVYYAHCMALYGTEQEERDVRLLYTLGFDVMNPNCPSVQEAVETEKLLGNDVMERVFKPLAQSYDALAFRALPDGSIPSGVAKEIRWAQEAVIPVIELPSAIERRILTLKETREYLVEVGQR